jgi:diguanylate cyclase (GGDEF)-like protein
LHIRLIAAIGVVCLSLIAVSAVMIWRSRVDDLRSARSQGESLALSLAQQATDTLITDHAVLFGLVERIKSDGTSPLQLRRLHQVAVSYVASVPALHGIFIMDSHGNPVVTALPATPKNLNYADREDFHFHATHRDSGFHMGPPIRSKSDGTWILTISERLNDTHGGFAGMASCTISMAYFEKLYGSVELGRGGVIDLIRDDGLVLVRTPFSTDYVGKSVAQGSLFKTYLPHASAGNFVGHSIFDGMRRLFAYRRLQRFPLIVMVAMPEAEVLSNWRSDSAVTIMVVFMLVVMISGLGAYLAIQVRKGQRMERELAWLAFHDGLTGISNRRSFDETLNEEWRRAARHRNTMSALMIDVDFFKSFNDTYGHQRGDQILKTIAGCAEKAINRPGDCAARYGGEEFVVLLPTTDGPGAFTIAERIRSAVEGLQIVSSGSPIGRVTISVGAASVVAHQGGNPSELIGMADAALYVAKHAGRNRTIVSDARVESA